MAARRPTSGDRAPERRCEFCNRIVRIAPVEGGNGKLDMCSSCARRRPIDLRKSDGTAPLRRPRGHRFRRRAARQTSRLDGWAGAEESAE